MGIETDAEEGAEALRRSGTHLDPLGTVDPHPPDELRTSSSGAALRLARATARRVSARPASDVHSLALTILEMVAGSGLFERSRSDEPLKLLDVARLKRMACDNSILRVLRGSLSSEPALRFSDA